MENLDYHPPARRQLNLLYTELACVVLQSSNAEQIQQPVQLGKVFYKTRSYAALRAADLDWIVGPGYSLGQVHSAETP